MKIVAKLLTYLSHPLFILTYGLILLILADPHAFGSISLYQEMPLVVLTLVYTVIFPLIAMLVMKLLGFVESLEMKSKEERIGPLIVTIVLYTWMFMNVRSNPNLPDTYGILALGSIISLAIGFLINVFDKISLHMVGVGGLCTFTLMLIMLFGYQWMQIGELSVQMILVLIGMIILSGLVGVARVFLGAHNLQQLFGGVVIGVLGQFLAWRFLL